MAFRAKSQSARIRKSDRASAAEQTKFRHTDKAATAAAAA